MNIRSFKRADYPRVQAIYQQGIDWGDATFETEIKSWDEWNAATSKHGRLVAVIDERVVGWACLSDVTSRCVYRGVAETSVYVDNQYKGYGIGVALIQALVEASEQAGYWTLQARIFTENIGSIVIHERVGFKAMGVHIKLGKVKGVWRDVALLERRSEIVGQD